MKKIYTPFLILFAFLLAAPGTKAQELCPGPNPPAVFNESWTDPNTGNQICALYIYNMWPNARVRVSGLGGAIIPPTIGDTVIFTDANGYCCYIYACSATPLQVSTCSGSYCCTTSVPARSLLPVKLTSFNTRIEDNQTVQLNWTSSVETASFKYVIERSTDGRYFQPIGEVDAAGNSSTTIRYSFTDDNNNSGVAFYRLKQVDQDGKYIYSKVVYANSGKSGTGRITRIFPNPFRSDVQLIGISTGDLNSGKVRVYNVEGRMIPFRISGSNAISIDATAPAGIYILQVKDQRFKLIKN